MRVSCNSFKISFIHFNFIRFFPFKFDVAWIDLSLAAVVVFWSFGIIFLHCEFGERITDQYNDIDDQLIQSKWYTFPIDVRTILPIIIKGTQSPVMFTGFGNIMCTRESFAYVSK